LIILRNKFTIWIYIIFLYHIKKTFFTTLIATIKLVKQSCSHANYMRRQVTWRWRWSMEENNQRKRGYYGKCAWADIRHCTKWPQARWPCMLLLKSMHNINISISESWNWSIFTHFLKNLFWFLAFWNRYSWVNHCGMWVDFTVDSYTYRRLGMIFSPYIFHVLFLFCWTYGISVSRVLCFFFFFLNCKSVSGHIVTKAKWYRKLF
jgi:hypothetical protein